MKLQSHGQFDIERVRSGRRILMLLENESFPDDTRVMLEAQSLHQAGYQLAVICPTGLSRKRYELIDGVAVYRYPKPKEWSGLFGYVWEYGYSLTMTFIISLYLLVRRGFDAVHTHAPPDMFVIIANFYQLLGKRYVVDLHDLSPELFEAKRDGRASKVIRTILCWFEHRSCRTANRLIATNDTQRRVQIERGGASPADCHVVRNGPGTRFLQTIQPLAALRDDGRTIIGYVGVIGVQDGVDYLLRALDCLRGHFGRDDFRALVVGYGPAVDDLKRLTAKLGLEQFVEFTGYLVGDDLLRHIASFDICVTPDPSNSYNDSCTTIKTMEYMALAKPIVAFDLPENRVSAGDAALYATANSEQDLARLLARLIDSPREREILGQRGRQRVIESLTWEQQSHTLIKLYDNLLCPGVNAVPVGAAAKGEITAWPSLSGALEPSGDNEKVLA